MQRDLLGKHRDAQLAVYAVWFNMLPGDSRDEWPSGLLTDARVRHFWDADRLAGTWYAREVTGDAGVEWDAYFLYGPQAQWEASPSPAVSWGSTIVSTRERLERDLSELLNKPARQ